MLQVPLPKPSRLGYQSEKPFQSKRHHPSRSLRLGSGKKIEGCADADHRYANMGPVGGHPIVLFRGVQTHKENPCPRSIDRFNYGLVLLRSQRPKGWGPRIGDLQTGKTTGYKRQKLVKHIGRSAIEADLELL